MKPDLLARVRWSNVALAAVAVVAVLLVVVWPMLRPSEPRLPPPAAVAVDPAPRPATPPERSARLPRHGLKRAKRRAVTEAALRVGRRHRRVTKWRHRKASARRPVRRGIVRRVRAAVTPTVTAVPVGPSVARTPVAPPAPPPPPAPEFGFER